MKGVHIKRTEAHEDGSVQTDRGRVAGRDAVLGAADSGKAAEDGPEREGGGAV